MLMPMSVHIRHSSFQAVSTSVCVKQLAFVATLMGKCGAFSIRGIKSHTYRVVAKPWARNWSLRTSTEVTTTGPPFIPYTTITSPLSSSAVSITGSKCLIKAEPSSPSRHGTPSRSYFFMSSTTTDKLFDKVFKPNKGSFLISLLLVLMDAPRRFCDTKLCTIGPPYIYSIL